MILQNATIYTGNDVQDIVASVAVKGDRIVAVGNVVDYDCDKVQKLDLQGAFVYPGFTDAHVHLRETGYREITLDLRDAESLEHAMELVRQKAKDGKPGQWFVGVGWIEKYWPEKRFPTRYDIDQVVDDRPVVLHRSDGHTILVNSLALKLAGIDRNTADPDGGIIQRDSSGEPTGLLIDNAMVLVTDLMPPKTREEDKEALRMALERNARLGWTQTQNASGNELDIELLKELREEGKLAHRVYYALDDGESIQAVLARGPEVDPENKITVRSIKLFMDGALGSRGAALEEEYQDDHSKGLMLLSKEETLPILLKALKNGIQVEVHAIGDKANRIVLDWFEEAFAQVKVSDRLVQSPRWRIEHVQVIAPEQQKRLKKLRVIPSMQPSHAIGDMYFAPTRLGSGRVKNAYVWQGLIDLGLIIAGGSDAPVEVGDPLIEFYAAVVRKDLGGYSNKDWHIEQAVSRDVALKMFTIWPAYAAFQESDRGTIEVGKQADFTVFDKDIMTISEKEILSANVVMTVVGGRIVYQKK
ncbi:amidohydrolase [Emcibacter sp.]|uniref:amidohydrolase n=1 Tax=Emcibacter sp. TaxID=1979954 RepID=UPI002AA6FCD9|nr:amidohydrolase [Emcibacter sp.]